MSMDLVSFEPVTPVVRLLAKSGINKYKERRRELILKEIDKGLLSIDSHEVASDEFISAYIATEHALLKASSKRKFDFLINLFVQGSNSGRIDSEPDAYQEVLSIVDELSERELTVLYHLYNYERDYGAMEGQLSRGHDHQVKYLVEKTGLERDLVIALLVRLRRTGLIITHGEKSETTDLMMTALEIMFISPIADEIKAWVLGVIEGVFVIES